MSEDQEKNRQEEHWRELAQLLGIGPEPPASKAAPAKEPAPPPPPLEVKKAPPPPEPVRPVAESPEEVFPGPVTEETLESPWEEPPIPEVTLPEDTGVRQDRREEEKPRRGRRRKGRRGGRDDRPPARTEEDATDLETRDEELPYPEDSDNGEEEAEEAPEAVEAQTDDDFDEADTLLRDWNVPPWNELIASLYRPDR